MKLRQKFLLLVALLLLLVLGGSFYLVFKDLRQEFLNNFERQLESSLEAFRSQEGQRFQTLRVLAGFLESSPSFRTVLRRSDYETLYQYLLDVNGSMQVTLMVVTDLQGKVVARTDRHGESGQALADQAVISTALEGETVSSYWLENERLYQVVVIPLVDSQDYVDGTLTLGFEIDSEFLEQLKRDLGAEVGVRFGSWKSTTQEQLLEASNDSLLVRELKLKALPESTAPRTFLVGRDLSPMQNFVRNSQLRLVQIGGLALLLALAVSVPLIGKMTNPVELLQQAKAEMETIISSNLDGLLATDEKGTITTCNSAAAVALGFSAEDLVGSSLSARLPETVKEQLQAAPGLNQSASFVREGRTFKLYRTYVKVHSSELLGTIVLIHDVTLEQEREHAFLEFLSSLKGVLDSPEAPPEVRLGLRNLETWARLKRGDLEAQPTSCPLSQMSALENTPEATALCVAADPLLLSLALDNLHQLGGGASIRISRDGGAVQFELSGRLPDLDEEPYHAGMGIDALYLYMAGRLLELQQSRLQLSEDRERAQFSLPLAVEVA